MLNLRELSAQIIQKNPLLHYHYNNYSSNNHYSSNSSSSGHVSSGGIIGIIIVVVSIIITVTVTMVIRRKKGLSIFSSKIDGNNSTKSMGANSDLNLKINAWDTIVNTLRSYYQQNEPLDKFALSQIDQLKRLNDFFEVNKDNLAMGQIDSDRILSTIESKLEERKALVKLLEAKAMSSNTSNPSNH